MNCVFCNEHAHVIDTREKNDETREFIYRRRECTECKRRFSTKEYLSTYEAPPLITFPKNVINILDKAKHLFWVDGIAYIKDNEGNPQVKLRSRK